MKKFIPFDSFEKACSPKGKTLHETMQENCNARLAPEPPVPCSDTPCPPYWQATGELRCLGNGLVDREEADGCGNSRWVRTVDRVLWVEGALVACVDVGDATESIFREETNQCGDVRRVNTGNKCCTPAWIPSTPLTYDCTQLTLRVNEEDGCGNTRLNSTDNPVLWSTTGDTRCQPGDIFEVEQTNQCGETRWFATGAPCPCVPEWVDLDIQRCTGTYVEEQQSDGCGATRWLASATEVAWTNTGAERCGITDFVQLQQVNQCGTTRWFTTATSCAEVEPPAPTVGFGDGVGAGGCYTVTAPGEVSYFINFGSDGQLTEGSSLEMATIGNRGVWAPAGDVALYEIKCGAVDPADGMTADTWYPMPRTLIWSLSSGGAPVGEFLDTVISIRRISDGLPIGSTTLDHIQLGVGTECV